MSRITHPRRVDLAALPFEASAKHSDDGSVYEANVSEAQLRAAVEAAPLAQAREDNAATIRQQAQQALAGNRTYATLASPTNAQTVAQVKALSRQQNGLIRLLLGALDGTD